MAGDSFNSIDVAHLTRLQFSTLSLSGGLGFERNPDVSGSTIQSQSDENNLEIITIGQLFVS